jgi:antitoxin component YwqK of YwqJK toxin-antitoxin module
MKKLVLLFAALLVAGCGEKESPVSDAEAERIIKGAVHIDDVAKLTRTAAESSSLRIDDDGRTFLKSRGDVFGVYSGWEVQRYESGQVRFLFQLKDGIEHGLSTSWHKNGQKRSEATYKDGKIHGLHTMWYENGQKQSETNYKNGKKDGHVTTWYNNGQKVQEETYKDGKRNGPAPSWHKNGQKRGEGTIKDSEWVSAKWWNDRGEEVETWQEADE